MSDVASMVSPCEDVADLVRSYLSVNMEAPDVHLNSYRNNQKHGLWVTNECICMYENGHKHGNCLYLRGNNLRRIESYMHGRLVQTTFCKNNSPSRIKVWK